MNGDGFTLDSIVDLLAQRVAARVRAELAEEGKAGGQIRPRLLTVEQGAAYLGRTKAAMQHMVASRKIPVVRDGHRVFLDIRALDRWIEANTEAAESGCLTNMQ